ncbi:MAG: hypothetical protein ACRED5_06765 [Propylenella sp.]
MAKLIVATLTAGIAIALGAAFSSANAAGAGCAPWVCGENGTQVTGIAVPNVSGTVIAVILPSASAEPAPLVVAEKKKPKPKPRPNPFDDLVQDNTVTPDEHATIHTMTTK